MEFIGWFDDGKPNVHIFGDATLLAEALSHSIVKRSFGGGVEEDNQPNDPDLQNMDTVFQHLRSHYGNVTASLVAQPVQAEACIIALGEFASDHRWTTEVVNAGLAELDRDTLTMASKVTQAEALASKLAGQLCLIAPPDFDLPDDMV